MNPPTSSALNADIEPVIEASDPAPQSYQGLVGKIIPKIILIVVGAGIGYFLGIVIALFTGLITIRIC